jgi:hypothetical protein
MVRPFRFVPVRNSSESNNIIRGNWLIPGFFGSHRNYSDFGLFTEWYVVNPIPTDNRTGHAA